MVSRAVWGQTRVINFIELWGGPHACSWSPLYPLVPTLGSIFGSILLLYVEEYGIVGGCG